MAIDHSGHLLLPTHVCTRGKGIDHVIIVMDTKIAKSGVLGAWASCKYNKYVECGKKTSFTILRIEWHSLQASQIVYFSWPSKPRPPTVPTVHYAIVLSAHIMSTTDLIHVGKCHQQHTSKLHYKGVRGVCALRALVIWITVQYISYLGSFVLPQNL